MSPLRVVVTAAGGSFVGLRGLLEETGCVVADEPLLAFEPPDDWTAFDRALAEIDRFQAVAVTSPRAAASLAARLPTRPCRVPAWATGEASARALDGVFLFINVPQSDGGESGAAERLAQAMIRSGTGSPVLFPCGTLRRDALIDQLSDAGIRVEPVICYRTVLASREHARQACAQADVLVVTSPSVAQLVASACDHDVRPALLAVGSTTAAAARLAGWAPAAVAERPDGPALCDAVLTLERG